MNLMKVSILTTFALCMSLNTLSASAGLVGVLDGRLTSISSEIFTSPNPSTLEASGIVELVGASASTGSLFINIDYDPSDPSTIVGPFISLTSVDDGSPLGDAILSATSINSSGTTNIEINGVLAINSFLGSAGDDFYLLIAGLSANDLGNGFGPLTDEGTFELFTAAVPLPGSILLFGIGVAAFGCSRRRSA